jgi:hypothetical protein
MWGTQQNQLIIEGTLLVSDAVGYSGGEAHRGRGGTA